nr:hypothetical protein [Tanacetum cinerariifolium]
MVRQKAILDLALQFDNACTAKDDLEKVYEKSNLLKQRDILLGLDEAVMSTQQYMKKVVEDVGEDEDFKSRPWVSATDYVNANGGTEDDFEPGVILGRSFLRLAKGVVDLGNRVATIYPEPDPFENDSEKQEIAQTIEINYLISILMMCKFGEELPPFVCKMWKSNRNKKREMENLNIFYQDVRPSSSAGERHVIETMAYHDKYKKILDEVWKDKAELDGKIVKEEEDAVKRIKGEALKKNDDPGAFIFPIILEGKVNENALADTGSDINTMPYRIYKTLGREEMKKIDRGFTMINHTQVEAMGKLSNVLCQVGVTTIIAKFLILDIPIDRDAPIVVGRGFLYTMSSILNTPERLFSTFDGVCHQTFQAVRFDVLSTSESDSDDDEEYVIKRNKLQEHTTEKPDRHDPNAQDNTKQWRNFYFHKFTTSFCYGKDVAEKLSLEIDDMLRIRLREAGSNEEIFTCVAWIRAFNINEPIYAELCHEFYSTYEFDEVYADDELLGLYQAVELEEEGFNVYFEGGLRNDNNFNAQDYWLTISRQDNLGFSRSHNSTIRNPILRVIHKMITYGLCQRTTGLGKCEMDEEERSWDSERESNLMWMEIHHDAIDRMEYRQSYHWDRYHGVFKHMAGVYSVPLQGAYNPPGYTQPQYDQYYQQYQPPPPQYQQQDDDE